MSRFLMVAAAAVFAVFAANAQTKPNQRSMGKMGGQDHAQAAASPAERYLLTVYALPEMQNEVGLSAQQVAQLRQYRQDFIGAPEPAKGERELAAAETLGKMKTVLTSAQLEKLAAIEPAELHTIAMSRLAAEDSGKLMAALPAHEEAAKGCEMMKKGDAKEAAGGEHSHH